MREGDWVWWELGGGWSFRKKVLLCHYLRQVCGIMEARQFWGAGRRSGWLELGIFVDKLENKDIIKKAPRGTQSISQMTSAFSLIVI